MAASGPPSRSTSRLPRSGVRRPAALLGVLLSGAFLGCGDTLYEPGVAPPDSVPTGPVGTPGITLAFQVVTPDRIELQDSVVLLVAAFDPSGVSGIDSLAYTAIVRTVGSSEVRTFTGKAAFQGTRADTAYASFVLRPSWLTQPRLPSQLQFELYGLAYNRTGACAAAVNGVTTAFPCQKRAVNGDSLRVGSARPADVPVQVVRGRTTLFPSSSIIVGDLVVDLSREKAYLSNRLSNRLHVFRPGTSSWDGDVSVGSEPWGLHMNATGDTLLVANSGGTSVTSVSLNGTPREAVSERIQTRNTALFEIDLLIKEDTLPSGTVVRDSLAKSTRFFDFSDRPQFVGQDAAGRVLYSTRPTGAAPRGTVRVITKFPGWEEPETRILARIPMDVAFSRETITVLHADSVVQYTNGFVEVWDHIDGFPSQVIRSGIRRPTEALLAIDQIPESDVEWLLDSKWDLGAVSFSDTTYVAVSADRVYVAFGDGGEPAVGRIVLWHAGEATISQRLTVEDLLNNASERVRALELNGNGTLGMARGSFGSYFFSTDLRLRGTVPEGVAGGGGAALHPSHPNVAVAGASSTETLAFTVTGDRMIRILDTVHYGERGRIILRNSIAGPLRVTLPFPSDNNGQGTSCVGPTCVVAKVFAVTSAGGVVVVDVRASDIQTLP